MVLLVLLSLAQVPAGTRVGVATTTATTAATTGATSAEQDPFCPAGWEPLRGDACLLRGERPGVVVYFHGMSAPSPKVLAWELSFPAKVPASKRPSLVVLRGTAGLCDWADEYRNWWCWPTAKPRQAELQNVVDRLSDALTDTALRIHFEGFPVIAGYSNGGYLVSMLISDTRIAASGWAILHAGPVMGMNYVKDRERPTLLIAATDDSIQRPSMETLKQTLEGKGWRPQFALRPGQHPPEVEDFSRLFEFAAGVLQ